MFTGPSGVGKRTLALTFAMTLNCQSDPPEGAGEPDVPCGLCTSCGRILRGEHPDVTEINLETQATYLGDDSKKATPAKELRIDTIREMQRTVGLSPYMGRWKVYILGDANRMNEEAANALLKTLEEPPSQTILLLLAPDDSSVLPTISSRCIQVPLRALPRPVIASSLVVEWEAEQEQAEKLAALSGGRLGWAVTMLENPAGLVQRSTALEEMALMSGNSILERVNAAAKFAKRFTDARPELYAALDTWEGWWRDVLVVEAGAPELVINVDQLSALRSLAKRVPAERAHDAITLIQQTRRQLQENVHPRLALEALALGLP
jgi:DNA polymerase-3 subunit delta'